MYNSFDFLALHTPDSKAALAETLRQETDDHLVNETYPFAYKLTFSVAEELKRRHGPGTVSASRRQDADERLIAVLGTMDDSEFTRAVASAATFGRVVKDEIERRGLLFSQRSTP